ncbi:MAG: exo-beta-N-acetylmuramidase NamZ family protein [Bacillota bacterium]
MKKYKTGLEIFLEKSLDYLKDKQVALLTNHTGLTNDLEQNIDLFYENKNINLTKLFAPEHGIRGNSNAGDKIENEIDQKTNLEVISLYGDLKKPSLELLEDIDIIIFDIQDIGLRFYTYLSTLLYTIESCGESNTEIIVLDRMNPLGRKVEGNIVKDEFRSFVGLYPLPHRHGMTFGELAKWANEEFSLNAKLRIVKCSGWNGEKFNEFDNLLWVPPSPGIPHYKTALIYAITVLFEGTNISEGRGTTKPFEYFGAPWIEAEKLLSELKNKDLNGVKFRPIYFKPCYSKYKDEECEGLQIFIDDKKGIDSYYVALNIIKTLFDIYPEKTKWIKNKKGKYFFDLLMGTDEVRKSIDRGEKISDIVKSWNQELNNFLVKREKYLLY